MAQNMDELSQMGLESHFGRVKELKDMALEKLQARGCEVIGHREGEWMSILSFKAPDEEALREELLKNKVLYSEREGHFRFAFHLYNSPKDLDFL